MNRVLVTGGAGYIGSHLTYSLLEQGYEVLIIDDLSTGYLENLPGERIDFFEGDAGDKQLLTKVFAKYSIDAVIHLAASTSVPESIEKPQSYYRNNVDVTRRLIEVCIDKELSGFVFSSSAAVYGPPEEIPVSESAPTSPATPYGRTKLIGEWLLDDFSPKAAWPFGTLRYFNVAGADPEGRTGQSQLDAKHLIKVASQAALGYRDTFEIFGTDYDTRDGTCIRDFIHVSDLADIHVATLKHLDRTDEDLLLNCGYGSGFSVREVIETMQEVSENDFEIEEGPRRTGDIPAIVSDVSRLNRTLNWEPSCDSLETILKTALDWETKLINQS
jgi:UDP-glucose 4-epimerase